MKKRFVGFAVFPLVFLGAALMTSTRGAQGAAIKCKDVRSSTTTTAFSEGCTGIACVSGTIHSGLLKGTFVTTVQESAPQAGLASLPATTSSFTATTLVETNEGTLTGDLVALIDGAEFSVVTMGRLAEGTGKFAGATGTIWSFAGTLSDGTSEEGIVGEVCYAE